MASWLLLAGSWVALIALWRWFRANPDPPRPTQLRRRQLDHIKEVEQ